MLWFSLPEKPRLLQEAAATVAYIPNVIFALDGTDYLANTTPSAFQQYWSLGIEEQFYLLWPLLRYVIFKLLRGRRRPLIRHRCGAGGRVIPRRLVAAIPVSATAATIGWENPLPLWVKIILAAEGRIRVQRYTKTSCPAADIPATFSSGDPYPECEQWRQAVQAQIAETKPALVLIANYSTAQERNDFDGYERGLAAVLAETEKSAPVVVLQDVPELSADPIACLARNPKSALRCALPTSDLKAIEDTADYQAARQAGAGFWVTRQWFCTDDACPLIQGEVLVYRDPHHITANFSRVLAAELAPLLAEELNGN